MSQMAGQTGAVITGASGVYFIPEEDLKAYRLPDNVAADVRAFLEGEADDEVVGFVQMKPPQPIKQPTPALIAPVTLPQGPSSSIATDGMLHTATRW